jgi:hypothetical protein
MPESTVTLSNTAHATLIKLAEISGETMQTVLDKAIENMFFLCKPIKRLPP